MSIVRHSFHIISKQLAYFSIIIATLLLLAVASIYWLSHAVEQRQDEIATWVGEYIGYPVTISGVGIYWTGFEPKLQVDNITIFRQNGQEQLLSLEQLFLGLDLIASIQQTEPVINDVSVSGLAISVIRDRQGKYVIQGLATDTEVTSPKQNWLAWAKLINSVNFERITLSLSDFKQPLLSGHYVLEQAKLDHEDNQWQTTINLSLPSQVGQYLSITADSELNDKFEIGAWQANLKVDNVNLAAFSDLLAWEDIHLTKGQINSELWLKGNGNAIESVTSSISANDLQITSLTELQQNSTIEQLSAQLDWSHSPQQWQVSGRNVVIRMNGAEWLPTTFKLVKDADNKLAFTSDYLRLSDLTTLAALSEFSPEFIRKQKPAGDVESLTVGYSPEQGVTSLAFKLRDGGLLPWNDLPGVTGLTASVSWNNDLGSIAFDSHQLTLYPESWLEKSVYFDSITGLIRLNHQADKWLVQSQALRLWNDDLTLQLDGSIERHNDGQIINDLVIGLQDVAVNSWKSYVPQHILEQDFKEWSEHAFVAGKVLDGQIELKGNLSDFPYDNAPDKGLFTMALQIEGAQLHYAPEWPDIIDVKGTIKGEGSTLVISSKQGKIAGFDFLDVTTTIKRYVLSDPILTVNGDMAGTTQQALQFLQNSPLKQRFGSVAKTVVAQGQSDIHLDLMVPLTHVDDTQASGNVSFKDSAMKSTSIAELALSNVVGELKFNNDGVFADTIKARFLDDELVINVSPEQGRTTVIAKGKSSVDKLKSVLHDKVPEFVSGPFDYQVDVAIAEKTLGDFYVDAVIHSDLLGVAIDLPAPFTKNREQVKTVRAGFEHVKDDLVYTLEYDDLINTVVMPQDKRWRGEIRLGSGQASLAEHGIKLRGQLDQLAVDDWLAWQSKQMPSADTSLIDSVDDISVTINELTGFEQKLTQVNLSMQRDAQGWRTQFHSEQSKGSLYLPLSFDNNAMLKVDLDKANLTFPSQDKTDTAQTEKIASDLWPAMAINIGALTIDGMDLGQLSLRSKRTKDAWMIEQASLTSDYFTATIPDGIWQKQATGDSTHISLQSNSDDLAGLLKSLGYVQAVDATGINIGLDFSWPADPLSVSLKQIQGQLNLKVGKGELPEVEPGAAGRIFGLLSVAAIPRRLSLDFSDLFGKGFNFDSISGSFNLKNGLATTDDMVMQAESALIEMSGPIDIVNKSYNQKVKVTPNVSSTLPLAGAMAGGPVGLGVGTAILLFDKIADNLFDKNIVNLISYKYDLTGPWDDPQLTVVKPAVQ